jgi:methionyl-tRNA synthetase
VRVELDDVVDRFGPDAFRYYILRDVPWNGDGEFSWDRFEARYTADLADDLGNLVNRVVSMIERYRAGVVPDGGPTWLVGECNAALARYREAMDANLLHLGATAAMDLAATANGFVEARAPWSQAKDPAQSAALDATLASLARSLIFLATLLSPFMPARMAELAARLGFDGVPALAGLGAATVAGRSVRRGTVLFPKDPPTGR